VALCNSVFLQLGIKDVPVLGLFDYVLKLKQDKKEYEDLRSLYTEFPLILKFFRMYESISVSEAEVERLFSFFHRSTGIFLRKNLSIETLKMLGRVYLSKIVPNMKEKG
jgi:hypothetical protein